MVKVNGDEKSWSKLIYYNEDLTYNNNDMYVSNIFAKENEIVKVEIPYHPYAFMDLNYERYMRKLLWKREEIKEVTMAEVEEKFGCKVKIISDER